MTKDRPRNRPGRGPSNTGFKPPRGGPDRPGGRGPDSPANPAGPGSSGADSDNPWEKRRPERAAPVAAGRTADARTAPKSWGKPRPGSGPDKSRGEKPRDDRPKGEAPRGERPNWSGDRSPRSKPGAAPAAAAGKRERFAVEKAPPRDVPDDDIIETLSDETDGEAAPWDDRRPPIGRGRGDRRQSPGQHFDKRAPASFEENGDVWIWGLHAAGAALANPMRRIREALLTRNAAVRLGLDPEAPPPFVRLLEPREIDHRLPEGAVHQGACVRAGPLDPLDISDMVSLPERPLVILDQLTDPQNVGAVFRSAAAFGFGGVVMQTRRAPGLGGALAKAAAGGIETTPEVRAVNLARAIDVLTDAGWLVVGLDGSATMSLAEAYAEAGPLAIVLGAEGSGLRPAVAKACSRLARIPMPGDMESLNVSNAAAIAFYEASRRVG